MARGIKKHLKRLNAPKHWMLDKLGGIFAPKPSAGPHKLRECLPLLLVVRNRLKFALNGRECQHILMQRLIKVDGKVRTDMKYPAGFMDVITIENADQHYRLLYDTKGRFVTHGITAEEAQYKLCKVKRKHTGKGNVPYIATHDGRTIRYPDPDIKVNDTILYNLVSGKVERIVKFEVGNMCMLTGGANNGRVGHIVHREKHKGSFEIIHIKDSAGRKFATRINNVFVIGQQNQALVSLPKGKGFKLSILQEQAQRFGSILTEEAQEE